MKVAVLKGGESHEAEVSRASAREVAVALQAAGHDAQEVELDAGLTGALAALAPDVVFPALHGPPGEDGTIQGYLEILGYPYVGSGVRGSATAMDKSLAKAVFRRHALPVIDDLVISPDTPPDAAAAEVTEALGDRVVIKPLCQGSAIGVTRLPNGGDMTRALADGLAFGDGVLVERYVLGREITVGVLDLVGQAPRAFPVIEILTAADEWYDYENRYAPGKSQHVMPAALPDEVAQELQRIALTAHVALGLCDLSRADFLVTDADEIALLEVNTLPGMTPTSLYPEGGTGIGLSFAELLDALVTSALARRGAASG